MEFFSDEINSTIKMKVFVTDYEMSSNKQLRLQEQGTNVSCFCAVNIVT